MKREKVTTRDWTRYFEGNLYKRATIDWSCGVTLQSDRRSAIVASLQRFQIGESGEGHHLKKHAAQTGDAEYCRAIELFIGEENHHARMLADALVALNAPLLRGHWSDAAFIVIRRFAGLKLELMILLVAELIAKRYYRVLHDAVGDENIRAMCLQILRDENAHVAFHCDTFSRTFARYSPLKRNVIRCCWKSFYRLVCRVVAWDHRGVLRAAGVSKAQWMRDTEVVFERAVTQIFACNDTSRKHVLAFESRMTR